VEELATAGQRVRERVSELSRGRPGEPLRVAVGKPDDEVRPVDGRVDDRLLPGPGGRVTLRSFVGRFLDQPPRGDFLYPRVMEPRPRGASH
jgi:hypothetical protein